MLSSPSPNTASLPPRIHKPQRLHVCARGMRAFGYLGTHTQFAGTCSEYGITFVYGAMLFDRFASESLGGQMADRLVSLTIPPDLSLRHSAYVSYLTHLPRLSMSCLHLPQAFSPERPSGRKTTLDTQHSPNVRHTKHSPNACDTEQSPLSYSLTHVRDPHLCPKAVGPYKSQR